MKTQKPKLTLIVLSWFWVSGLYAQTVVMSPGSTMTIDPQTKVEIDGDIRLVSDPAAAASLIDMESGSLNYNQAWVERVYTCNSWHLISSPVSEALSGMFIELYLQSHDETTNLYSDIIPVTVPLNVMEGYALFNQNPGFSVSQYNGIMNSGEYSFDLTRNNEGWNLVGNPYPSSIFWDAPSGWIKMNVNNAIYFESNGQWATWINGVGTNGGLPFIPSGQGFFVECSANPGVLTVNNRARIHVNPPFYKNEIPEMVRLEVSGNGLKDEAVIRFQQEATGNFDGMYDAHKMQAQGNYPEIYFLAGDRFLSVSALPACERVSVGFRSEMNGVYTISATEIHDLTYVGLEDKLTGAVTNLTELDYSFTFSGGQDNERFVLHFVPLETGDYKEFLSRIHTSGEDLFVYINDSHQAHVLVYDLSGKLNYNFTAQPGNNIFSIGKNKIYIAKVLSETQTITQKISTF